MIDFSCKHDYWIRNDDGSLSRMDEPYFRSWKLGEGIWRILSAGDYSYLVEGDDEALAIDSGYGAGNIREYMQTLTKQPVRRIANTHHHFDHTANNSYFEMAYMSEETSKRATRPFPSFSEIDFPKDYPRTIVKNGDYIPLKGRDIQAFLIPDHAIGSLAFLDRKGRALFSGDEFMGNRKSIKGGLTSWIRSLERLSEVRGEFDIMYGGAFTMEASLVDRMLICAKNALKTGGEPAGRPSDFGEHLEDEYDKNGHPIYDRMRPHPEDRGKSKPEDPGEIRRAVYEDIEIIFNISRLNE